MNRVILAILLLFSPLTSTESWASGSNTVFFPLKSRQYLMSAASHENLDNPQLQSYLERVQTNVYIARVNNAVYESAAYYALRGYDVLIDFEGLETITFQYYPSVDALIGFNSKQFPVILLESGYRGREH